MSIAVENLRRDARMRVESDREMSVLWVIIPLLPIIGFALFFVGLFAGSMLLFPSGNVTPGTPGSQGAAFAFFGFLILFYFLLFIASILYTWMIYKLVKRRNTHFARQLLLYDDLLSAAKEIAGKKSVDVAMPLNNLDRSIKEARVEETEKSAALWAILSFITGIASLYVFYFLMKDFFKHERREDIFFDDLNKAFATSGVSIRFPPRTMPVPDRSFALYFILTLITFGLFGIYWIYVLLTDPNNHFRQQWMIEDTVLAQVTPILGPSTQPTSQSPSYTFSPSTYTPPPPYSGPGPGPGPTTPP